MTIVRSSLESRIDDSSPEVNKSLTALSRPARWRTEGSSKRKRSYPGTSPTLSGKNPSSSMTLRAPRSRHSLNYVPLKKAIPSERPDDMEFKPSWLKSSASTPQARSLLVNDEIEDPSGSTLDTSLPCGSSKNTPKHLTRPAVVETPAQPVAQLISPYESERKSSNKLGVLRLKLSKVIRLSEAEEARMLNIEEFRVGDLHDPRSKASRIMDCRVLSRGVREELPFVAISLEVVSDVSIRSTSSDQSGLAAGAVLTAYFKPLFSEIRMNKDKVGALIRIFNPIVLSNESTGACLICTQLSEIVSSP